MENCGFIMLPHGEFSLVDEDDLDRIEQYYWHTIKKSGYVLGWVDKEHVYLHRFLMGAQTGTEIDHRNQSKRDNRKANLRFCTALQNGANKGKLANGKSSRFKGVARKYHRWTARAKLHGKRIWLGQFKTEVEAARAYNEWALQTHGDFACLNQL